MLLLLLMLFPARIGAHKIRSTSMSKKGAGECGPFRLDTLAKIAHFQEVRETDLSHETDL